MPDRIVLPAEFLPIDADATALLILSDAVEERNQPGDAGLAQHLRATARIWQGNVGIPRWLIEPEMEVWARFSGSGWSRAVVFAIGPRKIQVVFPYRPVKTWTNRDFIRGERAWWDLEPCVDWSGQCWPKPKPRRGYCTGRNAALAAALMAGPVQAKSSAISPQQPELFAS